MVAFLPSMLSGTAANAATSPSVPVAGVLAFGIGAGQLGNSQGGSQSPAGLAFDGKGDLFVADPVNNRVIEYSPSAPTSYPQAGTVVAGAGGQGSGLNQLYYPNGVALDAAGDLFVADSGNNRVVEYTYNGATGSYGSSGKVVAGTGTAGSGLTQLSDPLGIAFDASGDLFVADSGNNRVEEFAYNSTAGSYAATATTVAGAGGRGSGASQLAGPGSVTVDVKGDLFVADSLNARVMEYAFNAATGTYVASGTQVTGSLPNLAGWVTLDASGDLFVSYGYLGYGGVLEFPYNSATGSYASTGRAVASADQVGPSGLAFNPSGDLFVGEQAQTSNPSQTVWDLVLEFTYNASTGIFSPLGTIMSQSGRMNQGVSAVAVDSHGNLFASDAAVYEFPFNSAMGTYSAQGTQVAASGSVLALDSGNDLFVASSGTAGVLEYPWNATSGSYPSSGEAVPGATQLSTLTVAAMALDARNDLFVATSTQVLEFPYNASAGTYAATGTVIATVAAGGLTLDTSNDLFISNPSTSQVQEYLVNSATGAYASTGITVAGTGGNGRGPTS
jgi:sugar lactone lactonase YvrE